MKNFRLLALLCGVVAVGTAGVLVACSSEDTTVTPTEDAGADVVKPPVDSGPETSVDAGDAGVKLETFPEQLANALCRSQSRCCFGNPNLDGGSPVDGGTYNRDRCQSIGKLLGFETSSAGFAKARPANVVIDQAKGVECVAKVDALICNTPGSVLADVRSACFNAFQGQLAAGQDCLASVECKKGNFCTSTDGGLGKCTALRAADAACGDWTDDVNKAEEACSWRGGGEPGLHCETFDLDSGLYTDAGTWTCKPSVANGQPCNSSVWCAQGLCDPTNNAYVCTDPLPYFGDCKEFITP
jgi:hypothetical protein